MDMIYIQSRYVITLSRKRLVVLMVMCVVDGRLWSDMLSVELRASQVTSVKHNFYDGNVWVGTGSARSCYDHNNNGIHVVGITHSL